MKKIILTIAMIVILVCAMFTLTGCKFTVEAEDNSVTASVDENTTEKVDGVLDWIKKRLERLFN